MKTIRILLISLLLIFSQLSAAIGLYITDDKYSSDVIKIHITDDKYDKDAVKCYITDKYSASIKGYPTDKYSAQMKVYIVSSKYD